MGHGAKGIGHGAWGMVEIADCGFLKKTKTGGRRETTRGRGEARRDQRSEVGKQPVTYNISYCLSFTVYQIEWQHAARGKLQLLLQPLPGDLHDGLEVDHVSFIVFKQSGKGVGPATEMLVPEHNRLVAAHLLDLGVAKDSKKRLDSF